MIIWDLGRGKLSNSRSSGHSATRPATASFTTMYSMQENLDQVEDIDGDICEGGGGQDQPLHYLKGSLSSSPNRGWVCGDEDGKDGTTCISADDNEMNTVNRINKHTCGSKGTFSTTSSRKRESEERSRKSRGCDKRRGWWRRWTYCSWWYKCPRKKAGIFPTYLTFFLILIHQKGKKQKRQNLGFSDKISQSLQQLRSSQQRRT